MFGEVMLWHCRKCEKVWKSKGAKQPKKCPKCKNSNIEKLSKLTQIVEDFNLPNPTKPRDPVPEPNPKPEIESIDIEIIEAKKLEQKAKVMKAERIARELIEKEEEAVRRADTKEKLTLRERKAAVERDEIANEKSRVELERLRNSPIPSSTSGPPDNSGDDARIDKLEDRLYENMQAQIDNKTIKEAAESGNELIKGGMDIMKEQQRTHNVKTEILWVKGMDLVIKKMGGKDEIISFDELEDKPEKPRPRPGPREPLPEPAATVPPDRRRDPPPRRLEEDLY